jgi:hypothetical protein
MQRLSSFWEPFYSFWWGDWVGLPDRDDKDYDNCIREQKLSSHCAGTSNADPVTTYRNPEQQVVNSSREASNQPHQTLARTGSRDTLH